MLRESTPPWRTPDVTGILPKTPDLIYRLSDLQTHPHDQNINIKLRFYSFSADPFFPKFDFLIFS